MLNPYESYRNRAGVRPISWQEFHGLCKGLALAAAPFDPEIVLGIARGGLYAATLISHLLRKEMDAIRLTRRVNDVKQYEQPVWRTRPPAAVRGARVLLVDEISGAGETLSMAKEESLRMGATAVRCAVMYAHKSGVDVPDYIGLISDELILNPWDREILLDGEFVLHPEYVAALEMQGLGPEPSFLPGVEPIQPIKKIP